MQLEVCFHDVSNSFSAGPPQHTNVHPLWALHSPHTVKFSSNVACATGAFVFRFVLVVFLQSLKPENSMQKPEISKSSLHKVCATFSQISGLRVMFLIKVSPIPS